MGRAGIFPPEWKAHPDVLRPSRHWRGRTGRGVKVSCLCSPGQLFLSCSTHPSHADTVQAVASHESGAGQEFFASTLIGIWLEVFLPTLHCLLWMADWLGWCCLIRGVRGKREVSFDVIGECHQAPLFGESRVCQNQGTCFVAMLGEGRFLVGNPASITYMSLAVANGWDGRGNWLLGQPGQSHAVWLLLGAMDLPKPSQGRVLEWPLTCKPKIVCSCLLW